MLFYHYIICGLWNIFVWGSEYFCLYICEEIVCNMKVKYLKKCIPMVMSFLRENIRGLWSSSIGTPGSYNCTFNLQRYHVIVVDFWGVLHADWPQSEVTVCILKEDMNASFLLSVSNSFQRCAKKGWCWGLRRFVREQVNHLVGILHGVQCQPVTIQGGLSIGFP